MIINKLFSDFEIKLLNIMVPYSLRYSEKIFNQLNYCDITREKTKYYSLTFLKVKDGIDKLPNNGKKGNGIVLEMIIQHKNKIPTDILLHCSHGYLNELEIYNADSSEINYDMKINDYEVICNID